MNNFCVILRIKDNKLLLITNKFIKYRKEERKGKEDIYHNLKVL